MHAKRPESDDDATHLVALATPATDDDLVRLAQVDTRAFAPLYERYAQPVYYYCYRRLNHPEDAADATTAVFTRALTGLPRFHPNPARTGSTFRAWLYTIARNVVTDHHRTHRSVTSHDQASSRHLFNNRVLTDPAPSPEEHAIHRDDAETVHRLLNQLPERQRQIIELRLAGLTMPEIATSLAISESAARSHQVRGYRSLRDLVASSSTPAQESNS